MTRSVKRKNRKLRVLVSGLSSKGRIATRRVKWDAKYQERHNIELVEVVDLSGDLVHQMEMVGKRIYLILGLRFGRSSNATLKAYAP